MADLDIVQPDEPERLSLCPKLFSFRVRLEGQEMFQPASAFGRTIEKAKELLQDRFEGKIVEFQPRKLPKV